MNIFKKKPKETTKTRTRLSLGYSDFPNEALEITYKHLMEDYNANPNEQTGRKLQDISKILNDRAYKQGNGKLYQEINEIIPLSQEKFNRMTTPEKENLKRIVKQKQESDEAIKKLSEPQPDLDGELDNYENEYGSVDKPSPQNEVEVIHQTNYDKKQEEEVVLLNDITIKDPLVQTIDKIKQQQPEIFKKKPKKLPGLSSFFKKKKLIRLPKELDGDFVMKPKKEIGNARTYSEKEVQELLKKKQIEQTISATPEPTAPPEPISAPQKHEQLVETRLKGLFKKKDKEPKKEKEQLPDLICPDCSHHIKAHQKKGEPTGCKCGCLNTPDQIINFTRTTDYSTKLLPIKMCFWNMITVCTKPF